jgi:IQ motif/SEC7 domain-containing protein
MGSGNMLHFFLFIGIDDGADIDRDILVGIYERVKANEFKPGSDHVTQVMKVQSTIVGKKPVSNFV